MKCSVKAVDPAEKLRLLSAGDKSEVIRDKRSAERRQRLVTVKKIESLDSGPGRNTCIRIIN